MATDLSQLDLQPIAAQMDKRPEDPFLLLIDKVVSQGAAADVIGKMLDHYERWQHMKAKTAFDEAMQAMKSNAPDILKKKTATVRPKDGGQGYSYKYADLDNCCDVLDPHLTAHGFSYRWKTTPSDKGIVVTCILTHKEGHSEESPLGPAPVDNSGGKNPIQGIGSTVSYLQRYTLLMAVGIAPKSVDNDAQPPRATGGKMDAADLKERLAHFDKCDSYEEVNTHYAASFQEARRAKDDDAEGSLIKAKKEAYARLRGKQ